MALPDPQAKLERADEHIGSLSRMIRAFGEDAYRVEAQPAFWSEPGGAANHDEVIIFAEASEEPPSLKWTPIIGDIAHGLRSALDQIAWSLSVAYQATLGNHPPADPIPRGDRWRGVAFPICRDAKDWGGQWGSRMWATDPALKTVLEQFQPYFGGKNPPDREPLAVLDELWNIDKHRHLHLVNATIEVRDVFSVEAFPGMPHIEFEVVSKRAPGPLVGPTEIGRARMLRRPDGTLTEPVVQVYGSPDSSETTLMPIKTVSLPQMHMNPDLAVDVAFSEGAPAYGGSVLQTLSSLRETVNDILAAV